MSVEDRCPVCRLLCLECSLTTGFLEVSRLTLSLHLLVGIARGLDVELQPLVERDGEGQSFLKVVTLEHLAELTLCIPHGQVLVTALPSLSHVVSGEGLGPVRRQDHAPHPLWRREAVGVFSGKTVCCFKRGIEQFVGANEVRVVPRLLLSDVGLAEVVASGLKLLAGHFLFPADALWTCNFLCLCLKLSQSSSRGQHRVLKRGSLVVAVGSRRFCRVIDPLCRREVHLALKVVLRKLTVRHCRDCGDESVLLSGESAPLGCSGALTALNLDLTRRSPGDPGRSTLSEVKNGLLSLTYRFKSRLASTVTLAGKLDACIGTRGADPVRLTVCFCL